MQGEFKIGFYLRVLMEGDPNFQKIGLIQKITEYKDYDKVVLKWPNGSTSTYHVSDSFDDFKVLLSREYAIETMVDLNLDNYEEDFDENYFRSMSNDELLSEICLSGYIHDDLIEGVFDDERFKRNAKLEIILK